MDHHSTKVGEHIVFELHELIRKIFTRYHHDHKPYKEIRCLKYFDFSTIDWKLRKVGARLFR